MGGGLDIGKAVGQYAGATLDPFNISGKGGIPGVNSGGNGLIGEVNGANARDAAIAAQTGATGQANQFLSSTYKDQQSYLNPYNQAGLTALSGLGAGQNSIMNGYQASDAYKFQLSEGQNAINNSMAARGLGNSSAAAKALAKYSQGLASQDAQQYYNNEVNRLNTLAGYGSNAANNMSNNAGNYGASVSNNLTGLGNATASANIAQGNQMSQLLGQGIGAGAMLLASDERVKKNMIEVSKEDLEEMRSFLKAYYYEYLSDEHGEGEFVGIKAQDLEKSKLGKYLVVTNSQGIKVIDMKRVLSMWLATMAQEAA